MRRLRPDRRPEVAGQLVVVGAGEVLDGADAELARGARAVRAPMPQIAVTGRSPIVAIQVRRVSRATPPGLANPVAVLACSRVSPMPTAHDRPRLVERPAPADRVGDAPPGRRCAAPTKASSQPHTSTDQPNDRSAAITSRRGGVVGRVVRREEHGVGAAPPRLAPAACPSARRTPAPRRTPWRRPGAAGPGRRRRRRRPAARPAPGAAAPRRRPGTGRGRRAGSMLVAPKPALVGPAPSMTMHARCGRGPKRSLPRACPSRRESWAQAPSSVA